MSDHLPTAVVCANDRIAIGVLDALRRAGVDVPGQVSITGYDDSLLAQLGHIDLTSVSQAPREQAEPRRRGGRRTSRRGPYGAGVLGSGAAAGRTRDDGGSG